MTLARTIVEGWKVRAFLSVFGVWLWVHAPAAYASSADGTWMIRDLALEIFDCKDNVCGRIVWTRDPDRRATDCGRRIVWGLSSTGQSTWEGGSIFDPDDGSTYNLNATLQPDGTLRARIFRGIPLFGKTEILRRIAPKSLAGWC